MASLKVLFGLLAVVYLAVGEPHVGLHSHTQHGRPHTDLNGPDYDVPLYGLPKVNLVHPRLGAKAAVYHKDGMSFQFITGGLSYLPALWPANLEEIESNIQYAVKETNVYNYNPSGRSSWMYGPWRDMNAARAFHASEVYGGEIYVWGGGSATMEKLTIDGSFWEYQAQREEQQFLVNYEPIGTWTTLNCTGDVPSNQYASAVVLVGNILYVYGGISGNADVSGKFYSINLDTMVWAEITAVGPSATFGSSLDYHNGSLYLFGGRDQEQVSISELWQFEIATSTWTKIVVTDEPRPSALHASFIYDNNLVIVLGEGFNETEHSNWRDIWIFSFVDLEWSVVEKPASSPVPPTRSGFTTVSDFSELVLFNGVRDTGNWKLDEYVVSAEIWTLDFVTLRWKGRNCYPGYYYNTVSATCVEDDESWCKDCKDCEDMSQQRVNYVHELRVNTKNLEFAGSLRQCPAVWRGGK